MKFTDFLTKESCVMSLASDTKEGAIAELVAALAAQGKIGDPGDFTARVMKRESLGSTGVGKGIAIPHCPAPSVSTLVMAIGRSSRGIEFGAVDRVPVNHIFLMGANPAHLSAYLTMLASLSRLLTNRAFREEFERCGDPAQLVEIFRSYERQEMGG